MIMDLSWDHDFEDVSVQIGGVHVGRFACSVEFDGRSIDRITIASEKRDEPDLVLDPNGDRTFAEQVLFQQLEASISEHYADLIDERVSDLASADHAFDLACDRAYEQARG